MLEDLSIKPPFMYALHNFLMSKNIDINVEDTNVEIRRKIYGNRD